MDLKTNKKNLIIASIAGGAMLILVIVLIVAGTSKSRVKPQSAQAVTASVSTNDEAAQIKTPAPVEKSKAAAEVPVAVFTEPDEKNTAAALTVEEQVEVSSAPEAENTTPAAAKAESKASAATTEEPVVLPTQPKAESKAPASATEEPVVPTTQPKAESKAPASATEEPVVPTTQPKAESKAPAAATEEPVVSTTQPEAESKAPGSVVEEPVAVEPEAESNTTASPVVADSAPVVEDKKVNETKKKIEISPDYVIGFDLGLQQKLNATSDELRTAFSIGLNCGIEYIIRLNSDMGLGLWTDIFFHMDSGNTSTGADLLLAFNYAIGNEALTVGLGADMKLRSTDNKIAFIFADNCSYIWDAVLMARYRHTFDMDLALSASAKYSVSIPTGINELGCTVGVAYTFRAPLIKDPPLNLP